MLTLSEFLATHEALEPVEAANRLGIDVTSFETLHKVHVYACYSFIEEQRTNYYHVELSRDEVAHGNNRDDVATFLYFHHYCLECLELAGEEGRNRMIAFYGEYLQREGLPEESADELIWRDGITPKQRQFLSSFSAVWEHHGH